MAPRQVTGPEPPATGRAAQRRRTRAAIVDAATGLIRAGRRPSIDDIAAAADVSRRTVYMYFPTLDQLLLDATVGALSAATFDAALPPTTADGDPDAAARVDAMIRSLTATANTTLPLGRRIIALTVDAAPAAGASDGRAGEQPRRGYRRIDWLHRALEPMRDTLSPEQFDRLVAALALVAGWEAMVVLRDVVGLTAEREDTVLRWAAASLVAAMTAEAGGPGCPGGSAGQSEACPPVSATVK